MRKCKKGMHIFECVECGELAEDIEALKKRETIYKAMIHHLKSCNAYDCNALLEFEAALNAGKE